MRFVVRTGQDQGHLLHMVKNHASRGYPLAGASAGGDGWRGRVLAGPWGPRPGTARLGCQVVPCPPFWGLSAQPPSLPRTPQDALATIEGRLGGTLLGVQSVPSLPLSCEGQVGGAGWGAMHTTRGTPPFFPIPNSHVLLLLLSVPCGRVLPLPSPPSPPPSRTSSTTSQPAWAAPQAARLIDEATDKENLGRMYIWWMAWM